MISFYFDPPEKPLGTGLKKWKCHVHGNVSGTIKTVYTNEEGELVFEHNFCPVCYDIHLQRHLDILNPVSDEIY